MARRSGAAHVATTRRRYKDKVYETHLLRRTYREGGKVKHETLGNLSHLPAHVIELIRRSLKGETFVCAEETFECVRSLPHGHVAAVVGTLRHLQLERAIARTPSVERACVVAMIAARILDPLSKLATARSLAPATATSTLGACLGLEVIDEDQLYTAMDWLLARKSRIEAALARRHLEEGTLALYDATSAHFEGRTCPLAKLGHARDGRKGKLQVVIGLLCTRTGCPVAAEVFEGNTGDPATLAPQIRKLRDRFGLRRIVLVGDRGMLTSARIREEIRPVEGLEWITALRAPAIRKLVASGALQLSLFDERDLLEITHPDYPDERLVVCRNPLLAEERTRKREALLQGTERELDKIVARTQRPRRRLKGKEAIGLAVGKVVNRYKVAKHFELTITDDSFAYERKVDAIAAEAALDGIYALRTSVPAEEIDAEDTVRTYKGLAAVERAFRCLKTVDLKVRPIHHRLTDRVRAHVLLCVLAYYVEWHMRQALAPLLFDDDDKASAQATRESVVAPAQRSARALKKAAMKRTEQGLPVHSFQTLLRDLATLTRNTMRSPVGDATFDLLTSPTPLQERAFDLLQVKVAL